MAVLEKQRPVRQRDDSPEPTDDRPDGLLSDKRKTLINYVSNNEFEKVMRQFTEQFTVIDKHVQELFGITEIKVSRDELEYLIAHKVSKDELTSVLPSLEAQDAKLKNLVEDAMEDLQIQVAQKLKKVDEKFVQLRKEFDFDTFSRALNGKANKEQVDGELLQQSEKLGTMDTNIICIA